MKKRKTDLSRAKAKRLTQLGILFAMALVLSLLESLLPAIPSLPSGAKLGLSNVVTMYALFVMGNGEGLAIALLKSLFVLFTRGPIAMAMSLAGGILSVLVMILLRRIERIGREYLLLSIFGAVAHNIGQLVMSVFFVGTTKIFYYAPILVLCGIVMGVTTGLILKVIMPHLKHINFL